MRKVILFNMVTLDGFFEGPDRSIDWHRVDDEFNEFAIEQLATADGLIFGRVTYELMASYWPMPAAIKDDPIVAEKMNSITKYVFSKTLDKVGWKNARLISGDAAKEVSKLRQQPGNDLFVFGSADLASTLIRNSLIDEYRIMVNPVILGGGNPLFKGITAIVNLKLQKARTFQNGNVLLYYNPA